MSVNFSQLFSTQGSLLSPQQFFAQSMNGGVFSNSIFGNKFLGNNEWAQFFMQAGSLTFQHFASTKEPKVDYQAKINETNEKISSNLEKLTEVENENLTLTNEINNLETRKTEIPNIIEEYQNELNKLNAAEEKEKVSTKISELKQNIKKLEAELNEKDKAIEAKKATIDNNKKNIEQYQQTIKGLKAEKEDYQKKLKEEQEDKILNEADGSFLNRVSKKHIDKLLENDNKLTQKNELAEALRLFRKTEDKNLKKQYAKLIVNHNIATKDISNTLQEGVDFVKNWQKENQ